MGRYNAQTASFGARFEVYLKPMLEQALSEPLTKTAQLYDIMDYTSESWDVELKTRGYNYSPNSFATWLLPQCKGLHALQSSKPTIFFYYFPSVDRLFYLIFDETKFNEYEVRVPPENLYHQLHYYSKKEDWTEITMV